MEYRSVKLPEWTYQNGQKLAEELARRGLESLPPEIRAPKSCPICGAKTEKFEAKYTYIKCPDCGYTQQDFTTASNFVPGVLLGLGLAALFYALKKRK